MSLELSFEYPANSGVSSGLTEFSPGDTIGVLIKASLPDWTPFTATIVWSDTSISEFVYTGSTNWFTGNANFQVVLPSVQTQGILVVTTASPFSKTASIGLGVGKPAPVVTSKTINWLLWGGIGLVFAVGGGLLVRKLIKNG
jgi:hypothetical protein